MKKQIRIIIILSFVVFLSGASANVETPYPLGTSDLESKNGSGEFELKKMEIEPMRWIWDPKGVELVSEESDWTLSQFKLAEQQKVTKLQIKNQKLEQKIAELELRLSRLEELHKSAKCKSR